MALEGDIIEGQGKDATFGSRKLSEVKPATGGQKAPEAAGSADALAKPTGIDKAVQKGAEAKQSENGAKTKSKETGGNPVTDLSEHRKRIQSRKISVVGGSRLPSESHVAQKAIAGTPEAVNNQPKARTAGAK